MKSKLTLMALAAGLLAGCATKPSSSNPTDSLAIKEARNKAIVLASEKAFTNKDAAGSLKDMAPGFITYSSRDDKPLSNIDTLTKKSNEFFHAFPDWKAENLKAVAFGDTVLVLATWSGTFKNDFPGMKANGKSVKYDDVEIFVLNNEGKIISQRNTQSSLIMGLQLGFFVPAK